MIQKLELLTVLQYFTEPILIIIECKRLGHMQNSVVGSDLYVIVLNHVHSFTNNQSIVVNDALSDLDVPQHYWRNALWTNETKVELFGGNTQQLVCVWYKRAFHTRHPKVA
uniref:Uncharacterized protein n=1 Tax=Mastacembelus armatus TaxID=205130 RepID=A0A3Q3KZ38_9TELE